MNTNKTDCDRAISLEGDFYSNISINEQGKILDGGICLVFVKPSSARDRI